MDMSYTTLIQAAELAALFAAHEDVVVLDCRHDLSDPTYSSVSFTAGHLPNALRADMETQLSGPHTPGAGRHPLPSIDQWCDQLAQWRIGEQTQVVVYDQGPGMFAARAWMLLQWSGHETVAVLDGGYRLWTEQGFEIETGDVKMPEVPAISERSGCAFDARRLLDADQLLHAQALGRAVVDSRTADRYRGENETIDRVGGHIPGAINRPFMNNLTADGRFKASATLRAELLDLFTDPRAAAGAIFYCGSGVTAAHNLLAMAIADLPGASLYAPSWSGWIEDPAHPVTTGDLP